MLGLLAPQVIEDYYIPPAQYISRCKYYEWRQISVKHAMSRMVRVIAIQPYL